LTNSRVGFQMENATVSIGKHGFAGLAFLASA